MAWAGGYVGDGVSTTNLAGRTLADLITGEDSDLTRLPWVNHRSPKWEPEPFRWLGTNVGLRVMTSADDQEARTGRPSRRAAGQLEDLGLIANEGEAAGVRQTLTAAAMTYVAGALASVAQLMYFVMLFTGNRD